jgi:hypothetical protein
MITNLERTKEQKGCIFILKDTQRGGRDRQEVSNNSRNAEVQT